MNDYTQATTAEILRHIAALQEIQKRNSPETAKWQKASEFLAPLFSEMARRTQS